MAAPTSIQMQRTIPILMSQAPRLIIRHTGMMINAFMSSLAVPLCFASISARMRPCNDFASNWRLLWVAATT